MANGVLLLSSLVFGLVHVLAVTRYEAPTRLEALLVLGVLTSIWNHGKTARTRTRRSTHTRPFLGHPR